jgi:hypothetical protein
MAVGVRKDLPYVRDAISYWITEYRACATTDRAGHCYDGKNMHTKFESTIGEDCAVDELQGTKLEFQNFLPIFFLMFCMSVFMLLCHAACDWRLIIARFMQIKRALLFDNSQDLKTHLHSRKLHWKNDEFDLEAFVESWDSDTVQKAMRPPVAAHFLKTDVGAWRRFTASCKRDDLQTTEKSKKRQGTANLLGRSMTGLKVEPTISKGGHVQLKILRDHQKIMMVRAAHEILEKSSAAIRQKQAAKTQIGARVNRKFISSVRAVSRIDSRATKEASMSPASVIRSGSKVSPNST